MKNALGIIYTAESDVELKDLTKKRSIAAVPIGGRYRIIDFTLSNMVNSGVENIGVITQNNYSSLMDHLGSGKEWDLSRKRNGLFILPPYIGYNNPGRYRGSIDALHGIMSYIRKSPQRYVVFSGSHMLCNISYDDAFEYHIKKNADITVIYKEEKDLPTYELSKYILLQNDNDGRITDIEVNPSTPSSNKISMKMYIMEKSLLEYLVEECVARGGSSFIKDVLQKKVNKLKIYGFPFSGYLARIDSILTYYKYNMELLNPEVRNELFFSSGRIYTKIKDEVPVKYTKDANVQNSIVADGCIIEGEIQNSVIFRGVRVCKGAQIKNSIIMQDTEVQENSIVENVILDKEVLIRRGKRLTGQENYPIVIGKGAII